MRCRTEMRSERGGGRYAAFLICRSGFLEYAPMGVRKGGILASAKCRRVWSYSMPKEKFRRLARFLAGIPYGKYVIGRGYIRALYRSIGP